MKQRKNLNAMSDAEIKAFVNAYSKLAASGGLSWFVQVHSAMARHRMHGTMIHLDGSLGIHKGAPRFRFLPWHRAFLIALEQKLQAIDPSVTVPYWDWQTVIGEKRMQPIPRWLADMKITNVQARGVVGLHPLSPGFKHQDGSLYDVEIVRFPGPWTFIAKGIDYPIDVKLSTPKQIRRTLKLKKFVSFTDRLEMRPTGNVTALRRYGLMHAGGHLFVGGARIVGDQPFFGTMSNLFETAADPIFWMHHAQVDRIWEAWIRQSKADGSSQWSIPALAGSDRNMDPFSKTPGALWDVDALIDAVGPAAARLYDYDSYAFQA